ncbi:CHAT domain-containing protein [Micromonospora wenchangensis]|uniref:CHAT domain-containing protein n=1 Tax=Micromonospora wenchangensis TaxID=1185415 RepID=UPI0033E64EEB
MSGVDVRALLAAAERTGETAAALNAARAAARSGAVTDLDLLSRALQVAFRFDPSLPLLTEALEHTQRAADLLAERGDPDLPLMLSKVASLQTRLAAETGDADLARRAVETGRHALTLLPDEHPGRPAMLSNFGYALLGTAQRTGQIALVREAVSLIRQALKLGGTADPHRGTYLSNLGLGLGQLADVEGDAEAAAGAVAADREALALASSGHADRARLLSNMQGSLGRLASLTGDTRQLREAARMGEESIAATRSEDPRRPGRMLNLANVYQQIHRYTGDLHALTRGVDCSQEAVDTIPVGHGDRPEMLNNLAGVLQLRHDVTGAKADLQAAVGASREAVEAGAAAGHPELPDYRATLGLGLLALHQATGESRLLLHAVEELRAAARNARSRLRRARYHNGLVDALHVLHRRTGLVEPLAEAVAAARAAVAEAPEGHPVRATAWAQLSMCLRSSYRLSGDNSELVESVAAGKEAVARSTDDRIRAYRLSNLAAALIPIGEAPEPEIIREAAALARKAADLLPEGHLSLASVLVNLSNVLLSGPDDPQAMAEAAASAARAVRITTAPPRVRIRAARNWGRAARRSGDSVTSLAAYVLAVDLLVLLAPSELDREDREFGLGEISGLAGEAAAAALDNNCNEQAVQLLERSRGVLFSQRIGVSADIVSQPPPETVLTYAADGPVAILNAAPHRCDVLVLTGEPDRPVRLIELRELTEQRIMEQANILLALCGPAAATRMSFSEYRKLRQDVQAVLAWLWDEVAGRVVEGFDGRRMWWCPVGAMAFLPWHAAGHHDGSDRNVLDRVFSSYTPTLRVLAHARRSVPEHRPAVVITASAPTGETPLNRVADEARVVRSGLADTAVLLLDATRAQVLDALPRHGIAHFACHGVSDWRVPSDSRLMLMDGPLTVTELSGLDLSYARLAYLSACSTTQTNLRLVDEAVHIAAGLMMAGFLQVVGTMWMVDDDDALTISKSFYATLRGDPARASEALCAAVRTLRDRDPHEVMRWAAFVHIGA